MSTLHTRENESNGEAALTILKMFCRIRCVDCGLKLWAPSSFLSLYIQSVH